MLATSPKWALRALTIVYGFQTEDEQHSGETTVSNGMGFSGMDANILSSFAQQIEKGRILSEKQMAILFKKMPRYWKQIMPEIPETFEWQKII